ncbi:MAG: GGDEF and EAL domain-containing protein [Bradyrhizobiaceae bacterium]|nr:MAG: GGDEF and EAL domain-containing protein [Bradyrhizobiaceae bacterium]
MFKIYNCIATAHDLRLVVLAAIVCGLSSFAAFRLLHHARTVQGQMRHIWLAVSAVAIGFGIWSTHFIAMLAFSPGIPSGYNIALTAISLVVAMLLTGGGLVVAMTPGWSAGPALGGAIVAGGIAAMHYTGMAAFEIAGIVVWDFGMVAWSIVLGATLGAIALPVGLHDQSEKWKAAGAALLTLAICSHHFTGMAAVTILPDPNIAVPATALPPALLAILVCVASLTIILLSLTAVALDVRDRRRAELETDRMRGLANAAVEGLVVCDGDTIVTVNESFAQLVGLSSTMLVGNKLDLCLPGDTARERLLTSSNQPMEVTLRHHDGSMIPAEVILRPIDYAGRPHHVVAVRDLRARKKNEQHIRYLAHHDALTSLPNRTSFNAAIDEALAALPKDNKLAVLCLDLDRFKEVNDLFGHAAGDRVLQTVANRIGGLLGSGQIMSRLGGDEFAILLPNIARADAARRFAENVLAALRLKGDTPETDGISSSLGIALYPDDANDRQMLLSHADTALYRAKTEGRNTYRFFEAKMGAEVRERRMIEHDLRHAVARNELRLVYQPQHDIQNNIVTGFEALLRWKHPTRGDVSPATFIPIAEEAGAILGIGEWVLRTACREAASWPQPLTIAVNVSTLQIYDPNFAHLVHRILIETGLSPNRLELEITETALVRDLNRALLTLRQIKALGVHIAMDDFGTGYSSLSNLRAFPFDKIKIDGSFIKSVDSNEQAATIVRTVLGLGRGLGLPVLAEGVETAGEMKFLREQNCDEIQGYLIGRPAAIENFREYTHNEAPREIADEAVAELKAG